jgi:hypothetical protein
VNEHWRDHYRCIGHRSEGILVGAPVRARAYRATAATAASGTGAVSIMGKGEMMKHSAYAIVLAAVLTFAESADASWEYAWTGQCDAGVASLSGRLCAQIDVVITAPEAFAPGISFDCSIFRNDPLDCFPRVLYSVLYVDGGRQPFSLLHDILFARGTFPTADTFGSYFTCMNSCVDFPLMIADYGTPFVSRGPTGFYAPLDGWRYSWGSVSAWGAPVHIPEPASGALLVAALLAAVILRKRVWN